jgi:hypothetical protein
MAMEVPSDLDQVVARVFERRRHTVVANIAFLRTGHHRPGQKTGDRPGQENLAPVSTSSRHHPSLFMPWLIST